jgi:hypothetical protein
MQKKQYIQSLQELHSEIKKTRVPDPAHSSQLQNISFNIQEILNHPGEAPSESHSRLLTSLRDGVLLFEASHPTLTGLMNNVIKTLNTIGI